MNRAHQFLPFNALKEIVKNLELDNVFTCLKPGIIVKIKYKNIELKGIIKSIDKINGYLYLVNKRLDFNDIISLEILTK